MLFRSLRVGGVEGIFAGLNAEAADGADAAFAGATAALIRAKSPLSVKIALAQLRGGRELDFDECMRTEFRIVSRIVHGYDFYEGIRAVIIDKDQAPRWRPASLAEVSAAELERHFAPLDRELDLP
jgi:enoyl-CoA hydratase/carnithine racemase